MTENPRKRKVTYAGALCSTIQAMSTPLHSLSCGIKIVMRNSYVVGFIMVMTGTIKEEVFSWSYSSVALIWVV